MTEEEWRQKERGQTLMTCIEQIKIILYGKEIEGYEYEDRLEEIKQAIKDLEEELREEF